MLNIGCHLSSAKGYLHMGEEALALGANTFQFFTRNPRGGRAKAIDTEDIRALLALMRENSFAPLLAHAPYTLNACSADSKMRDFARMVMTEDLQLLELLPGTRYNFHPGSHVKQGAEQGIIMIAELLNEILRPQQQTMVLLETMAGKGSEVGRNFTELRSIIDRVELQGKLGVCLDTCHTGTSKKTIPGPLRHWNCLYYTSHFWGLQGTFPRALSVLFLTSQHKNRQKFSGFFRLFRLKILHFLHEVRKKISNFRENAQFRNRGLCSFIRTVHPGGY